MSKYSDADENCEKCEGLGYILTYSKNNEPIWDDCDCVERNKKEAPKQWAVVDYSDYELCIAIRGETERYWINPGKDVYQEYTYENFNSDWRNGPCPFSL